MKKYELASTILSMLACLISGLAIGISLTKAHYRPQIKTLTAQNQNLTQERDELRTTLNENNMAAEINEGRLSIICNRAPAACEGLE